MYQEDTRMPQFFISFLLITGFLISLTAEGRRGGSRATNTIEDPNHNDTLLRKANEVRTAIETNRFAIGKCRGEVHSIRSIEEEIRVARSRAAADRLIETVRSRITECSSKISQEIVEIKHIPSDKRWYHEYIKERKYTEDFERYPELKKHFESKIEATYRQFQNYFDQSQALYEHSTDPIADFHTRITHPHFQTPTLPEQFNRMLTKLIEQRKCTPEKIKSCHESLLKQVEGDSKSGLRNYCNKALREGQVCCSNPNKSCGDFAFAKDITNAFSKSTPAIFKMFAQLRGIQGRAEDACKLSALGSVVTPLGNLQIDSCNQAIEGCKATCDSRIAKFKNDFKRCYKIQEGETIREIIKKAVEEEFEEGDPKAPCKDEIAKVAEAYKELSIDSSYNLSEESDHEEIVACRGEIGRYAPGAGAMGPAEQLAVNMCYGEINQPTAQAAPPPGPGNIPYTPPTGVAGFAGTTPHREFPGLSPMAEEGMPETPGVDDDGDFLPPGPEHPKGGNVGFVPSGGGGGSGGSAGLGGAGGGSSGGSGGNDKGARAMAGLGPGGEGDFAFQAGMEEGEGEDNNSWAEGDDFGPQIEKDRKKAEDLKKLPDKYLTDEERDLLRAFSPPGKHENIFDFHSFMFHWFCRNYGCSGYFKAMGIPEDMRRKILEPKKFIKKEEAEKLIKKTKG